MMNNEAAGMLIIGSAHIRGFGMGKVNRMRQVVTGEKKPPEEETGKILEFADSEKKWTIQVVKRKEIREPDNKFEGMVEKAKKHDQKEKEEKAKEHNENEE